MPSRQSNDHVFRKLKSNISDKRKSFKIPHGSDPHPSASSPILPAQAQCPTKYSCYVATGCVAAAVGAPVIVGTNTERFGDGTAVPDALPAVAAGVS
jgi:hypothetical protein